MKKSPSQLISRSILILFSAIVLPLQSQTVISSWNFDSGTKSPTTGNGSLTSIGGVVEDWNRTGVTPGSSTPAGYAENTLIATGKGMQIYNFPLQKTNPLTAGIQINMSTVGYKNIILSLDIRHGATSANKVSLMYTVDGLVWDRCATFTETKDDTWYLRNFNFKNFPAVNNNPNFAIKLVSNYDSISYVPVDLKLLYATSGPIRFDNIIFRGETIDMPDDDRTVISKWNFEDSTLVVNEGNGLLTTTGSVIYSLDKSGVIANSTIKDEGVFEFGKIEQGIGLQTINYPVQGTLNKTAGIQIMSNTSSYRNIVVSADLRHGNTAANNFVMQYTTDAGVNWIDATSFKANSGDTWYLRSYDFSSLTTVNNNAGFGVRFVSTFDGVTYKPVGGITKLYAVTGPTRFDNILIKGNLISALSDLNQTNSINISQTGYTIRFDVMPESNISVHNLSGVQIFNSQPLQEITIPDVPQGIYILKVNAQAFKIILK